jgi:hypothetical protein
VLSARGAIALSDLAGRHLQLVAPDGPAVDRMRSGAASLVSTAALQALADELGVDTVDGRRFRMHFGIDGVEATPRTAGSAGACRSARRS